jgi:hypothetical protein
MFASHGVLQSVPLARAASPVYRVRGGGDAWHDDAAQATGAIVFSLRRPIGRGSEEASGGGTSLGGCAALAGNTPASADREAFFAASSGDSSNQQANRNPYKEAMSPLPTQMADRWWQRPGRRPDRELYHWHLLLHDQPVVREMAARAQDRLVGLLGLDMVPIQWLHLTTYVVGFVDELPEPKSRRC